MEKLPKEILVYQEDIDKDGPYLIAQYNKDAIPDDQNGVTVGVYVLQRTHKFSVKRELK